MFFPRPGVVMQVEERLPAYTIRLEGALDERSAARLSELLGAAPAVKRLAVDLSRVRELEARELQLLAGALASAGRPVAVLGVGRHQLRLLQYLGAGPGQPFALDSAAGTPPG